MLASPSCPHVLSPQHHTLPSERSAQECAEPSATCLTELPPGNPCTQTGVSWALVVLFPSWPFALLPQHWHVPSRMPHESLTPIPAKDSVDGAGGATGTVGVSEARCVMRAHVG